MCVDANECYRVAGSTIKGKGKLLAGWEKRSKGEERRKEGGGQ
jgi:hypothetical protein